MRCLARIAEVEARWVWLRRILAVSVLAAGLAVSLSVLVIADMIVRGGHVVRFVLLGLGVGAMVWAGRRLARSLWPGLGRDDAALLLERSHPELGGRLVTAVQLASPAAREQAGASAGLYGQVCAAAERRASQLVVYRVLPSGPALRRSASAWVVVLMVLVLAGMNRDVTRTGLARLVMPWRDVDWPRRTQLEVEVSDCVVPRGGTLEIRGTVAGMVPSTGMLYVKSGAGSPARARFEIDDGKFSEDYSPVNSNLIVWAKVGDAVSEKIAVEMIPRPEVVAIGLKCTYPEYARQALFSEPAESERDLDAGHLPSTWLDRFKEHGEHFGAGTAVAVDREGDEWRIRGDTAWYAVRKERYGTEDRLTTYRVGREFPDGNVKAELGSRIELGITTNKPVQSATLEWESTGGAPASSSPPGPSSRPVVIPVPMDLDEGGTRATTAFAIEASQYGPASGRSYRIRLVHVARGRRIENENPVLYRIEMEDNDYPEIRSVTPARDKHVTSHARVPITAEITDDYGVTNVALCYRRSGDEQGGVERIAIPLERPDKRVKIQEPDPHLWPLEPLGLEPGETITYWLQARDAGEHAEPQEWPVSVSRRLHVVDEPALARMLYDRLAKTIAELTELERLQEDCVDAVARVNDSLAGPLGRDSAAAAREQTEAETWRQKRLARTASQLADELRGIAKDYEISQIGQRQRAEDLRSAADRLARIARPRMPNIVEDLDEALAGLRRLPLPAATQPQEGP